jgi:hypothetical protein
VTGVGALESDHYRQVGLDSLRLEPDNFRRGMELLRNADAYPNLRPDEVEGKEPEEIARAAIDHAKSNLRYLYEHASDEIKEHGPHWHEGAHSLAADQARQYHIPVASAAGVFAALSPLVKSAKQRRMYDRIKGKQLSELDDSREKALGIRIYDQAHNGPDFAALSADGRRLGTYTEERIDPRTHQPSGETYNKKCNWDGGSEIAKAIDALESNGDRNILSKAMGDQH